MISSFLQISAIGVPASAWRSATQDLLFRKSALSHGQLLPVLGDSGPPQDSSKRMSSWIRIRGQGQYYRDHSGNAPRSPAAGALAYASHFEGKWAFQEVGHLPQPVIFTTDPLPLRGDGRA